MYIHAIITCTCVYAASTEETTHRTTHVQPHKITKIKIQNDLRK